VNRHVAAGKAGNAQNSRRLLLARFLPILHIVAARIEDYGLIGDCETAALVGRDGSIDWLPWPRFDSPACFSALLGSARNGRWVIQPADPAAHVSRRYRGNTLILETRFETAEGVVTVIDFMPPRGANPNLVRIVRGDGGRVRVRTELVLRFDYGRLIPWVDRGEHGTWRAVSGPDMATLDTPVTLQGRDFTTFAEFDVVAGDTVPFVLAYHRSHTRPAGALDPRSALDLTETFWEEWATGARLDGTWSDAVMRSLLTLKALTYAPTGGIVAAPTTSLPEHIGGTRNWDYRFCWLRDASLTLHALMQAGYVGEAHAWRDWLLRAAAGAPSQMQIMYGLSGERRLPEWIADWLPGYEGSQPVRIGNAAARQLQLDVYGEVVNVLFQGQQRGIAMSRANRSFLHAVLEHLEAVWERPDAGIWEVRSRPRHFTYSKVMAWVAFDRAVRMAEAFGIDAPVQRWRTLRAQVHDDVCRRGFNRQMGSFVQSYGSRQLDASLLLLPRMGFLPATDPRIRGTIEAVERHLLRDGLVMRYDSAAPRDGLPPSEGAFLACSFWLDDAYVATGRVDDASALFERLMGLRNDLGLLSEEYDTVAGRQIGNFPQAFSHIALVNTAFNLAQATAERQDTGERLPATA
jgi:GH15 family glucan-1,4-alpha-glucosidase